MIVAGRDFELYDVFLVSLKSHLTRIPLLKDLETFIIYGNSDPGVTIEKSFDLISSLTPSFTVFHVSQR